MSIMTRRLLFGEKTLNIRFRISVCKDTKKKEEKQKIEYVFHLQANKKTEGMPNRHTLYSIVINR